jgi:hypothetical protein
MIGVSASRPAKSPGLVVNSGRPSAMAVAAIIMCAILGRGENCSCFSGGITVIAQLWAINAMIAQIRPVGTISVVIRGWICQ